MTKIRRQRQRQRKRQQRNNNNNNNNNNDTNDLTAVGVGAVGVAAASASAVKFAIIIRLCFFFFFCCCCCCCCWLFLSSNNIVVVVTGFTPSLSLSLSSSSSSVTRTTRTMPSLSLSSSSSSSSSSLSLSSSLFWPSQQQQQKQKKKNNKKKVNDQNNNNNNNNNNNKNNNQNKYYYDTIFDSIVKIYSTHNKEPDMIMPWQKGHAYTSTSSGFIIENQKIITNAHSIEYAGQVLIRKRGSAIDSKKYLAIVEIISNECDLAMLTINDDSFWYNNNDENDDYEEYDEEYDDDHDDDHDDDIDIDIDIDIDDDYDDENDDDEEYDDEEYDDENENESENENENDDDQHNYYYKEEDAIQIKPLEFGLLPELQDEVEVIGYPTGGDSLSVTKGVVSRIETTEYAQCPYGPQLLAIQIDAAINGGNSGGPVICSVTKKVIGVAFQSLNDAENIGYVIPITVLQHFLEDIKRNNGQYYSGVTCLGVRYAKLENISMRSYLKLPKDKDDDEEEEDDEEENNDRNGNDRRKKKKLRRRRGSSTASANDSDDGSSTSSINSSSSPTTTKQQQSSYSGLGIMVRSCDPITPSKQYLKPNDIILSVDGIPVSSDGNIPFRRNGRERVSFASYIQTKFVTSNANANANANNNNNNSDGGNNNSDTVKLDIWRDGKLLDGSPIKVPLCISKNLIPCHWNNQSPPYLIVGGFVFTVLSIPYLEDNDAWSDYINDNISYLMNKIHEPLQQVGDEIVILVNVLAHSTTLGYDNLSNLHLTSCNNKHVRSLKHLQELIIEIENDKEESEFIKFEFGGSTSSTSESSTESSTGSDGVCGEDQNENEDCDGDGGGTIVVLETKSLDETTREVCDEHYIQKPYYFPPTLQLQSQSTSSTTTTKTTTATSTMPTPTIKQDDDEDVVVELSFTSETTTATNSATPTVAAAAAATAITDDTKYSWEAELFKKSKPLVQVPPSILETLEVLKRDGVVRLNSSKFFVDEGLCSKLRNQILNEMNNKAPLSSSANNANGVNGDKKKKKERYVPGTRLRFDSSMDITFGGDVRHDMLLPIDFDSNEDNEDNDNEQHFPELRQVLESAASQLEPLLSDAVKDMLPLLHGSSIRDSNGVNGNVVNDKDESLTSSVELVEVASLIVRNGSGHQSVHADYRRFRDNDDNDDDHVVVKKEESIQNTNSRIGKMPPRIVVFVALQDIPSNEYGATGFITGTHNSKAHGLIYGRDGGIDNNNNNNNNNIDQRRQKKARQDLILDNVSTNGVRTTSGFKCGDMLIYDASVLHWGGKNSIVDNDRVMLYFGVSRFGSPALLDDHDQDQPSLPVDQFEVVPPVLLQDMTGSNKKSQSHA